MSSSTCVYLPDALNKVTERAIPGLPLLPRSTCRKKRIGKPTLVRLFHAMFATNELINELIMKIPTGMLDWDSTSIVFTKRTLIEFLKSAPLPPRCLLAHA
jgi:hypothetical protein